MKRRVIKQGNDTLTVTLPRKWARDTGIKAGDEIEVCETGNKLTIIADFLPVIKKISVDLSNLEPPRIKHIISVLYKKGYDEIVVKYHSKEQLNIIQDTLNKQLIGMEIIELLEKHCTIKKVISEDKTEFDNILRRNFLVLLSFSENYAEMLKKGQTENLPELLGLEDSINKFTLFYQRCINKGLAEDDPILKYLLAWLIESIGDCYRDLCKQKLEKKDLGSRIIALASETSSLIRAFYKLYYEFKKDLLNDFDKELKELNVQLTKEVSASKKLEQTFILINLLKVVALVKEGVPTIISLQMNSLLEE